MLMTETEFNQLWTESPGFRLLIVMIVMVAIGSAVFLTVLLIDNLKTRKQKADELQEKKKKAEHTLTEIMLNNDVILAQLNGILRNLQVKRTREYMQPGTEKPYIIGKINEEKSKSEIEIESMIAKIRQNNRYLNSLGYTDLISSR
jgi:hypothetical protein